MNECAKSRRFGGEASQYVQISQHSGNITETSRRFDVDLSALAIISRFPISKFPAFISTIAISVSQPSHTPSLHVQLSDAASQRN